ncbi:MAG: Mur ligase family protein [Planctomycetota bacterium]
MSAVVPSLAGRRTVVMGLGQFGGGVAAARYLAGQGARVLVTDLRSADVLADSVRALDGLPVEFVLGEHRDVDFTGADIVVANPAVSPANRYLTLAREAGAWITSEMELFLRGSRARRLLVSGTHGKSSTVTFLHQLLKGWFRPVFLGGNLGRPLLDVPGAWGEDALCVVEISSYQLEALHLDDDLRTAEGVGWTALAPDHLERHGDFAGYLEAKGRLAHLVRPGGAAVLPLEHWNDGPFPRLRDERTDVDWLAFGTGSERFPDGDELVLPWLRTRVPSHPLWTSPFQRTNLLLALELAHRAGLPPEVAAARLPHLRGLPHRMDALPEIAGRRVVDNGVSTTPESTLAGLQSLPAPAIVWIGGQLKRGTDYAALARACRGAWDRVHLFRCHARDLAWRLGGSRGDAVATVTRPSGRMRGEAPPVDPLLLPACANLALPEFRARARFPT